MKRRISVMIAALLLVFGLSSSAVFAEGSGDMFFYDDAGILTQTELAPVNSRLQEISDAQQCGVYVKTTNDFNGLTPNAYADDFYDGSGLGYGSGNSGIILVVNYESGDWAISTTGYAITYFTDAGQEYIMDYVLQFLRDDPETAFLAYADLCSEFITQASTGEPYDSGNLPGYGDLLLPGYAESDYSGGNSSYSQVILPIDIAIGIAIGVIIALIIMLIQKSGLKTVRRQVAAKNYIRQGSFNLTARNEQFLYSNVERIKKENQSSTGSSTHTSSSGTTHGGSSGKF